MSRGVRSLRTRCALGMPLPRGPATRCPARPRPRRTSPNVEEHRSDALAAEQAGLGPLTVVEFRPAVLPTPARTVGKLVHAAGGISLESAGDVPFPGDFRGDPPEKQDRRRKAD